MSLSLTEKKKCTSHLLTKCPDETVKQNDGGARSITRLAVESAGIKFRIYSRESVLVQKGQISYRSGYSD